VRRWNKDLTDQFGFGPAYALIVEALDTQLQGQATEAELTQKGAGIACILHELVFCG
jgi:hypothetical protein